MSSSGRATGYCAQFKLQVSGVETQGMNNFLCHRSAAVGLCFALVLVSQGLFASTQQFHASWEQSRWEVESRSGFCALSHEIPRFGRARFEQASGKRLRFSIHVDQPLVRDHQALLYSEAPVWRHAGQSRELGGLSFKQGKTPLRVPREQAQRIYAELEQGMLPVIEFADWGDGKDQVLVALMPVRFRESLPAFLACVAELTHLDFEPVAEEVVFFATNSDRLSRTARRTLEQIARDFRKRKDFRIVLGGYADARGDARFNMLLSQRRTNMAARFLRSRGVAAAAIESHFFGESQPAITDYGKNELASNRRVTIWLADPRSAAR